MPFIIAILMVVLFLLMLAFFIFLFIEQSEKKSVFGALESVLFLVMMPKNAPKKEGEAQKDEKMLISEMEQVLINFLHIKPSKIFQAPPSIALEIASQTGGSDILFYIAVPKHLETVFEKYVQGVYPQASVQKVPEDYTVFEPTGVTVGAYLTLKESFLFPISTYQKLEKDPLSTITNNLSKISADEGAAIQVIIRPSTINVKGKGEEALKKMREGKSARAAVSEAMQGVFMELFSEIFKPSPKKDDELTKKKEQSFDQAGHDAVQSKIQKQAFETNIRLIACSQSEERAEDVLNHLISSFRQFSLSAINGFNEKKVKGPGLKKFIYDFSFRLFNEKQKNILNTEELVSMYHFPT